MDGSIQQLVTEVAQVTGAELPHVLDAESPVLRDEALSFGERADDPPYLVGLKQAKEMLMLGERINAQEALRLGLVNRVVPGHQLLAAAEEMAKKLAALPQNTVRLNKALVNRAYEIGGFREALDYRSDPALAEYTGRAAEPDAHLAVLREQGWEAFRKSRDAAYGGTEAKGKFTG